MFNLIFRISVYVFSSFIALSLVGCKQSEVIGFDPEQSFQTQEIKWIKNLGQFDEDIAFVYNSPIASFHVMQNGELRYFLKDGDLNFMIKETPAQSSLFPKGVMISPTRINFLKGHKEYHRSNIPVYHQVYLGEAWPGIHYYLNAANGSIEKMLKILPGGEASNISFSIQGVDNIMINNESLVTHLGQEQLSYSAPIAWQEIDGSRVEVEVSYAVDQQKLEYGFNLGEYHKHYPLFIDPLLSSSFLGGSGTEEIERIVVDLDGSVVIGGSTSSMNFPVTQGSYDMTHNDTLDIFIARMSKDLSVLESCTFIGGEGRDVLEDLKIHANGDVYIGGSTRSDDYPTSVTAYDRTYNNPGSNIGYKDMIITALSTDLNQLKYSTFLGTDKDDYCTAIDFDSSERLNLIGYSNGRLPSVGPQFNANTAVTVFAKFNATLSTLIATNSVRGNNFVWPDDIVIDHNDDIFLLAHTRATDFPTTAGSFATTNAGNQDAVIFKVNNNMSTMIAASYFGGDREDLATKLMVDNTGNVYVTGYTKSSNFPLSQNAYSTGNTSSFSSDIFISKLSSDLSDLIVSTLAGGGGGDESNNIAMESNGNIIVTGTAGWGFPVFCDSYHDTWSSIDDGFIARFDPTLSNLLSSTYLRTSGDEECLALALNPGDTIYAGGYTSSPNFPATMSYDTTFNGGSDDAFILSIDPELNRSEPCCAELITPVPGTIDLPASFDIEWEEARSATGYYLSVGTMVNVWDIFDDLDVGNVHTYGLTDLPCGDTIYLLIQPYNNDGVKTDCEIYSLVIGGGFFVEENLEICDGDEIGWQGSIYNSEGIYQALYTDINGCDSIYQLVLQVNSEYLIQENTSICQGDTYIWFGEDYNSEGIYYNLLTSVDGCDSLFELKLELLTNYEIIENEEICEGENFIWQGMTLTDPGNYTMDFLSSENCDSIHILNLVVNPAYLIEETNTICEGETYNWQGMNLTDEGIYSDEFLSSENCDSIHILNLAVNPSYFIEETHTICQGDTYSWQGMVFDEPGNYMVNQQTRDGCDSTIQLTLSAWPEYFTQLEMETCEGEPLSWEGQELNVAGVYLAEYLTQFGCDSIIELHLSIFDEYYIQEKYQICEGDSLLWFGNDYSEPGTYKETLISVNGCDSIHELSLEVNPVFEIYMVDEICEGDTLLWNGLTLSEEGIYELQYQTDELCDSILFLSLNVNDIYSDYEIMGICEGESIEWEEQIIDDTGIYTAKYQSIDGCDSTLLLEVIVYPEFIDTETLSICAGEPIEWQGMILDQPGNYEMGYITQFGCDSIYQLELNVVAPDTTVMIWNDTLSTTINLSSTYQWYDCEEMSVIESEVSTEFIPESSGEYALIVEMEGCIDTSICYYVQSTSIEALNSKQLKVKVFPNPISNRWLNIELKGVSGRYELSILDINGTVIYSDFDIEEHKSINTGDLIPGVYFVLIRSEGKQIGQKIIII